MKRLFENNVIKVLTAAFLAGSFYQFVLARLTSVEKDTARIESKLQKHEEDSAKNVATFLVEVTKHNERIDNLIKRMDKVAP